MSSIGVGEEIEVRADEPVSEVLARLPTRAAGAVWHVRAPSPTPAGLQAWLETLREQIPEAGRPARFDITNDLPPGSPVRIQPPTAP